MNLDFKQPTKTLFAMKITYRRANRLKLHIVNIFRTTIFLIIMENSNQSIGIIQTVMTPDIVNPAC